MGLCLPTLKNEFTIIRTTTPDEFECIVYSIGRCDLFEIIIWLQKERLLTLEEKGQIMEGLRSYFKTNVCHDKYLELEINNQIFIFESRSCTDTGFMTILHFTYAAKN